MKSIDAKSRYFCWKSSTSFSGSSLLLREGRKREDPGNEVEKSWVSLWAPTYTSFLLHSHTRGIFYYPFSFHSLLHLLLHFSLQFLLLTPVLPPSHAKWHGSLIWGSPWSCVCSSVTSWPPCIMRVSGIVVAFRAPYVTRRVPGEFLAMSNYFAVDSHGFAYLLHPRFPLVFRHLLGVHSQVRYSIIRSSHLKV